MHRLLALAAAATLACGGPSADGPPDVILISVDTLRADHLGCYGHPRATSPFIDALAAEGVLFENAQATTSWTLPSHLSLMTSLHPAAHGVERQDQTLPPGIPTLAQQLQRSGYATSAFVSWVYVSREYGFARGFDHFRELLPAPEQRTPDSRHAVKADELVDEVLAWSEADVARPFFLWLHLFDPHIDYQPPLEHARAFWKGDVDLAIGRYESLLPHIRGATATASRIPGPSLERAASLYEGEIHFVDTQLGRLFEQLRRRGLLERAFVVFTSDHGEEFDDHGSMEGHGWTLYDEVTRVPLVLRFPDGRHAGKRVPGLVQTIDVAPTILALAGAEAPAGFAGIDLMPVIRGESKGRRLAFSKLSRFNQKWAVQDARFKLIYTADTGTNAFGQPIEDGFELYDLRSDPDERNDLYAPDLPAAKRLSKALERWIRSQRSRVAPPRAPLSDEERGRLRALGYLHDEPAP